MLPHQNCAILVDTVQILAKATCPYYNHIRASGPKSERFVQCLCTQQAHLQHVPLGYWEAPMTLSKGRESGELGVCTSSHRHTAYWPQSAHVHWETLKSCGSPATFCWGPARSSTARHHGPLGMLRSLASAFHPEIHHWMGRTSTEAIPMWHNGSALQCARVWHPHPTPSPLPPPPPSPDGFCKLSLHWRSYLRSFTSSSNVLEHYQLREIGSAWDPASFLFQWSSAWHCCHFLWLGFMHSLQSPDNWFCIHALAPRLGLTFYAFSSKSRPISGVDCGPTEGWDPRVRTSVDQEPYYNCTKHYGGGATGQSHHRGRQSGKLP